MHSSDPQPLAHLTVVPTEACHLCEQAERTLTDLREDFPFTVESLALDSVDGRRLVAQHRPAMAPLVLVDGQFFSAGRLSRRRLAALLQARSLRAHDDVWTEQAGALHG